MTSLIELTLRGDVTPHEHESNKAWWAFVSADSGKVVVKKWFPLDAVNDRQEMQEMVPDESVIYVLEKPFCSPTPEAHFTGVDLMVKELESKGLRVRYDSAQSPHFYLEKITKVKPYHRFRDIELD